MILSLIITWVFWLIIDIINAVYHPQQWYLFLIPPVILTGGIVLISYINSILCIVLTIGLHLFIVGMVLVNYFKK